MLYYLNQYRIAEGTSEATFLWEGKTYKYAKMRAEQLVDDFSHNRQDIIEVCNKLKFGEYCLDWGDGTGALIEPYYYGGCSEAITGPYGNYSSVDNLARQVASNIHASSSHWSYVGAETTKYITVGCYALVWGDFTNFYFCIATSSTNKYDCNQYDDKYHADYKGWCENYKYFTRSYLGEIINPADPSGKRFGINPERTEPWWDEWIAEMLAEGLIEQYWYDDMIEKGYIIEVD